VYSEELEFSMTVRLWTKLLYNNQSQFILGSYWQLIVPIITIQIIYALIFKSFVLASVALL
jgi:hypothetical protein